MVLSFRDVTVGRGDFGEVDDTGKAANDLRNGSELEFSEECCWLNAVREWSGRRARHCEAGLGEFGAYGY